MANVNEAFEALKQYLIQNNRAKIVSGGREILKRCHICGDSRDPSDAHMYIGLKNGAIVYNCFKCPAHGVLKYDDLELLGVEDVSFKQDMQSLNKSADKFSSYDYQVKDLFFEYKIPEVNGIKKIVYIEDRLGIQLSNDDIKNTKIITSLKDFLLLNDINYVTCKPNFAKLLDRDYVGFLNNNNSYILFRDITNSNKISWFKYPITNESKGQRNFYSISSEIDLYTKDKITINLSEGIMDCLSIAHNIYENKLDNSLNIAICGKFYVNVIKYLIGMGFVGNNICMNIYSDNDHTYDTSIEYYKKVFKRFSFLFGELNVYYNMLSKDCGVPKNNILLQKYKI